MAIPEPLSKENYFLAFEKFAETKVSGVALRVIVRGSDNETDLLLNLPGTLDIWQFDFRSYATYSVSAEDFTVWADPQTYIGNAYRIYRESELLDSLKERTSLEVQEQVCGISYRHFSFACMEHQVDVISADAPAIQLLHEKSTDAS